MTTTQAAPAAQPTAPAEGQRQPDTGEIPKAEAIAKDDPLSPKYAAIARREKMIRDQQRQLQREREALKAQESQYKTDYVPKSSLRDMLLKDPTQLGVTHEELLNLALNQPTPESRQTTLLEQKLQELENKIAQNENQVADRTKQAYEQAVNQIRTEAKLVVDSDPRFETIKERGAHDAITDLIVQTYEDSPEDAKVLLSVEEAATEVENYLIEEGIKMANLKRVKEKLSPAPEVPAQKPEIKPVAKTLTHAVSAQTPNRLTDKQRRERAVMAFRGQLQS